MKILLKILLIIFIVVILTTNCKDKESDFDINNYHVETSDFLMTVSIPSNINVGQTFYVEGTLKYIGTSTVTLTHGKPIIQFLVKEEKSKGDIPEAIFPLAYLTQVDPGTEFKVKV